jgi:aminopeptidase N
LPIGTQDDSWYIGNIQHSGWYRVNYDITNWNLLINQLKNDDHRLIHPIHRAQLLDDSFNLGRAEVIDQIVFFNISKYLTKETDGLAFTAAFAGFNFMSSFIEDETETYELFKVI